MTTEAGARSIEMIERDALRLINDAQLRADIVKPYTDCARVRHALDMTRVEAAVIERYSETVLEWVQVRATEIIEAEGERARSGGMEEQGSDGE